MNVGDLVLVWWGRWGHCDRLLRARVAQICTDGFRFQEDGFDGAKLWSPVSGWDPLPYESEGFAWARGWDTPAADALRVAVALS